MYMLIQFFFFSSPSFKKLYQFKQIELFLWKKQEFLKKK